MLQCEHSHHSAITMSFELPCISYRNRSERPRQANWVYSSKECNVPECNHLARPRFCLPEDCRSDSRGGLAWSMLGNKTPPRPAALASKAQRDRELSSLPISGGFHFTATFGNSTDREWCLETQRTKKKKKIGHTRFVRGYCISWASLPHINHRPCSQPSLQRGHYGSFFYIHTLGLSFGLFLAFHRISTTSTCDKVTVFRLSLVVEWTILTLCRVGVGEGEHGGRELVGP